MAPIKKRTSLRARAATAKPPPQPYNTNPTTSSASDLSSALKLRKQDKRHLKHAALMHKVRDASISKSGGAKKRRRPGKKMAAAESMGGWADALPEVEDEDEEWEGLSEEGGGEEGARQEKKTARRRRPEGDGKIKMHSLKHRPGAMKRKQILEKREQERFGKNLAQMVGGEKSRAAEGDGAGGMQSEAAQAQKWAALRAFIGGTMERDRAFGKG